jgi:hypothetical protein
MNRLRVLQLAVTIAVMDAATVAEYADSRGTVRMQGLGASLWTCGQVYILDSSRSP